MDILLNVHANMEGLSTQPKAMLRIDRAGLLDLISKVEQVAALKAQDNSIYCIERWDRTHPVIWFDATGYLDEDGDCFSIKCPGLAVVPEFLANQIMAEHDANHGESTRIDTSLATMITENLGVYWKAIQDRNDVEVETALITLDALKAYANAA